MATTSAAANAALLEAARKGLLRDAKRALKTGADVTCRDSDGWTSIMLAARRGDVEIVDVLVDSDATRLLGTPRLDGFLGDALLVAATHGQSEVVRMLLVYEADQDAQSEHGLTPMMQASKRGHIGIMKLLLDWSADAHAQTRTLSTALHLAARNGRLHAAQVLLEAGCDINAVDEDLVTPLMEAVREEHTETAELLMAKGACVDAVEKNGQTALHLAATKDDPVLVELLLKGGGGVCLCMSDTRGYTPFMAAAEAGCDSVLRLLLKKGAQGDATAIDGSTALHVAALNGHLDACRA